MEREIVSLVPACPGSLQSVSEHDSAVERLVARLRNLARLLPLQLALGIGELIVEELYGGDLTSWRQRGEKENSLRKLCRHPDLPENIKPVDLYRGIALFVMSRRMDFSAWKLLGYSHFRAVIQAPEERQSGLLEQANREGWTAARLSDEVAAVRKAEVRGRGGRPALPGFVKALHRLEKVAVDHGGLLQDLDLAVKMQPGEVRELEGRLLRLRESLDELLAALQKGNHPVVE